MQPLEERHSVREFRIVLPMSVEEYRIGQLWSVAEASKNETGGGEGVEVIVNEPYDSLNDPSSPNVSINGQAFTSGQYTHKVYHLSSKVPSFLRMLAPTGSLEVHEKAWNAYPYCRTVYSNSYMKENFYMEIESFYAPGNENTDNILNLEGHDLANREVVKIDIANDAIAPNDYKPEWDPCLVGCPKAGRSPLPKDGNGDWMDTVTPVMTCYKVVKVGFNWFGLQDRVESMILKEEHRLFFTFHRQAVCWQENYHGMTVDDIRRIEAETKEALDKARAEGTVRGMTVSG